MQLLAHDALHDAVLLCDKGILAVVISLQAALSLGLDPALKLGACLRTYVSHALVIFPFDSRPSLDGGRGGERSVLLGLDIIDE